MSIADAMASPTHWFYGGRNQVRMTYGGDITEYRKPVELLRGSIMSLSNTGGAGRGSNDGDIIGSIINHGKKQYWERGAGYHYHCTLDAGENTLEGQMARLSMRSMTKGGFDRVRMQEEYVDFMTKPHSHNDAYASTYHRMFFANRQRGLELSQCPDNDKHNVDAIDGLVMPIPVLLGTINDDISKSVETAQASVAVTRRSTRVEAYVEQLAQMLRQVINGEKLHFVAKQAHQRLYGRPVLTWGSDPVVACYIDDNFASLLLLAAKYLDFREIILANANSGGENVHRGLVLGALAGAEVGASGIPEDLKKGLKDYEEIKEEIDAFLASRVSTSDNVELVAASDSDVSISPAAALGALVGSGSVVALLLHFRRSGAAAAQESLLAN
eukprot:gnl/TRDRNA2_/TRDRNA2_133457_c0_seq2.p1 gnl/TRDRNA2_/TRDRNA2_133457_c0~~gnl/TRDRNA2_/TRDRNA2_133457_c0_seq2.p1  ORF type:complete len:434 (+),score=47.50 gnl/TRDRNA2_/TRDRNA2_133457_c0_seq2:148-1302(+)